MSSVAADFRNLAPVVVAAALAKAGTRVCQPIERFELDLPDEAFGRSRRCSAGSGRSTLDTAAAGGYTRLVGHLPSAVGPGGRLPAARPHQR